MQMMGITVSPGIGVPCFSGIPQHAISIQPYRLLELLQMREGVHRGTAPGPEPRPQPGNLVLFPSDVLKQCIRTRRAPARAICDTRKQRWPRKNTSTGDFFKAPF